MKFRKTRKGFTIVELVIVIAVIGILSAILIPTFIHLAGKAEEASDKSLVANLNTSLRMEESDVGNNKARNLHEAVELLKKQGYYASQLIAKSEQEIVYSVDDDCFYLSNDEKVDQAHKYKYFRVYNSMPAEQTWSIYANDDWDWGESAHSFTSESPLSVGFDQGDASEIAESIYFNGESREVVIRTNSVDTVLTVNSASSTVHHYDLVGEVQVIKTADASYHEFGTAGYVQVASGRVVAEKDGYINTVVLTEKGEGAELPAVIEIKAGGEIVNKYATSTTVAGLNNGATGAYILDINDDSTTGKLINLSDDEEVDDIKNGAKEDVTPPVLESDGVKYKNYLDVFEYLGDNGYRSRKTSIKLLADLRIPGSIVALGTLNLTIDLNGYTLVVSKGFGGFAMSGQFVLNDSSAKSGGVMSFGPQDVVDEYLGFKAIFAVDVPMIINGGTIDASGSEADVFSGMNGSPTVTINGGNIIADADYSIFSTRTSPVINGGTLEATAGGSSIFGFSSSRVIDYSKANIVSGSTIYKS